MNTNSNRKSLPWQDFFLISGVGLIFVLMNFPKLLTQIVTGKITHPGLQAVVLWPVATVQASLNSLQGTSPEVVLAHLVSYDFLGLWIFLVVIATAALLQKDLGIVAYSLGGLALGYYGLHLISWAALILVTVAKFAVMLVGLVSAFFGWIFGFLANWWLALFVLGLAAILFGKKVWIFLRSLARSGEHLRMALLALGAISLIGVLYSVVLLPLWRWVSELLEPILLFIKDLLAPVFLFIGLVLKWIAALGMTAFVVFLVLSIVGHLVVDQVRAALNSGRSRKELGLGGFALGSTLALVILMSIGSPRLSQGIDAGWLSSLETLDQVSHTRLASGTLGWLVPSEAFVAVMPDSVKVFVLTHFETANAPLLDSLLLLFLTAFATFSVLIRVRHTMPMAPEGTPAYFVPQEYALIVGGLLGGVSLSFAQALSEGGVDLDFG